MMLLLTVLTALISISSVLSLQCYSCNSMTKRYCDDPFDPPDRKPLAQEFISDCDQELKKRLDENLMSGYTPPPPGSNATAVCRKLIQKIDGSVRIYRTCGWFGIDEPDGCTTKPGSAGPSTYCHCKTGDFCNTSPDHPPLAILGLTGILCIIMAIL